MKGTTAYGILFKKGKPEECIRYSDYQDTESLHPDAMCSPPITYSTILEYSKVCGKIRGFKTGQVDNFAGSGRGSNTPLRGNYVDVSVSRMDTSITTYMDICCS